MACVLLVMAVKHVSIGHAFMSSCCIYRWLFYGSQQHVALTARSLDNSTF